MDLTIFYDGIKKQKRIAWIGGVVMLAGGIGLGFIPIADDDPGWVHFFKPAMVLFMIAAGIGVLRMAIQDPEMHKVIRTLKDRPETIVWGYVQKNFQNGAHIASVFGIGVESGKLHMGPIPVGKEQEATDIIAMAAPTATLGFHQDFVAKFKADPASMRRSKIGS